jgi:hypothetical protein
LNQLNKVNSQNAELSQSVSVAKMIELDGKFKEKSIPNS